MTLPDLFLSLADIFDSPAAIEQLAAETLREAALKPDLPVLAGDVPGLPQPFFDIIARPDAHPVCKLISQMPFMWEPPTTSDDRPILRTVRPKFMLNCWARTALSDQIKSGLVCMACTHTLITGCARIRQKKCL